MSADTRPIANLRPHYTDSYYSQPRTVWVAEGYKRNQTHDTIKGASYDYSDRLWQWDWNKADTVTKAIEGLDRRSPAFIQEFLRRYFDKPSLVLVHVMAGFNVGNGYPYQVYGYLPEGKALEGAAK